MPAATAVTTHQVRMRLDARVRTHIAQFLCAGAWDTAHQRLFAAWLRRHPEDAGRASRALPSVAVGEND